MGQIRTVILVFFLATISYTTAIYGQLNPFEITDRLTEEDLRITEQDTAKSDLVTSKPQEVIYPSTAATKFLDNPFEVNHVPIRKKDFYPAQTSENQATKKNFLKNTYPLWILLFSIILLSIVISQNRSLMHELSSSLLNPSTLNTLDKKYNSGLSISGLVLYGIFILNLGLFLSIVYGGLIALHYFYLIISLTAIYTLKHLLISISGFIFPITEIIKKHNFSIVSLHLFLGVLLIPINTVIQFSSDFLVDMFMYLGYILICLNILLRWLKGFFFASQVISSHPIHFFIYLCSFEILPWVVVLKIYHS